MLFRQYHLEGIRKGVVSLAFRKWKKPAVRKGSLIKTAIGQVEILDISETDPDKITDEDAVDAGFKNCGELLSTLNEVDHGKIYRITLKYHSPDPRVALRNQTQLSEEEFTSIRKKLERLDKYSKTGEWTLSTLKVIQDHPKLRAKDLAEKLQVDKDAFKLNVRKLKNVGLTISHDVGYSISPLGGKFLQLCIRPDCQ